MARVFEMQLTKFTKKLREDLKDCYDTIKRKEEVSSEELIHKLPDEKLKVKDIKSWL